jgi:hypothetical protein
MRRGCRRMHHIRADRCDDFLLTLPVKAQVEIVQRGTTIRVEPGSFALMSTAQPFDATITSPAAGEQFSALQVRVSGSQLRQRVPHADDCWDLPIRIDGGASHIMISLFEAAINESGKLSSGQAHRFTAMLIDAIANATVDTPELTGLALGRQPASIAGLRRRADAFIDKSIGSDTIDFSVINDKSIGKCHWGQTRLIFPSSRLRITSGTMDDGRLVTNNLFNRV